MFESVYSFFVSVIPVVGVFFAGWFFASDKNRTELYKAKISAYNELFTEIQYISHLILASKAGAEVNIQDI